MYYQVVLLRSSTSRLHDCPGRLSVVLRIAPSRGWIACVLRAPAVVFE